MIERWLAVIDSLQKRVQKYSLIQQKLKALTGIFVSTDNAQL